MPESRLECKHGLQAEKLSCFRVTGDVTSLVSYSEAMTMVVLEPSLLYLTSQAEPPGPKRQAGAGWGQH